MDRSAPDPLSIHVNDKTIRYYNKEIHMHSPLISIIIPVYNIEKYITRCIRNITAQSFQDYELILVDDGSSDASCDLCRAEAEKNNKIKLICKMHEGSGYARNTGIEASRGTYLLFIDGDDYILGNCLERTVSVAIKEHCDIVQFRHISGQLSNYNVIPEEKKYTICNSGQAFSSKNINVCIWGKLIRRDLMDQIRYPKVSVHDDEFITYKTIYAARRIAILNECYYYHYKNPSGLMLQKREAMPFAFFNAFSERFRFFKEKNEPHLIAITHKEFASRLMFAAMSYDLYNSSRYSFNELFCLFKQHYKLGKGTITVPGERILFTAFRYMPYFMKYLYGHYKKWEYKRLLLSK